MTFKVLLAISGQYTLKAKADTLAIIIFHEFLKSTSCKISVHMEVKFTKIGNCILILEITQAAA